MGSSLRDGTPAGTAAAPAVPAFSLDQLALDRIAMHWREALDGAEDTLDALSHSRRLLGFPAHELGVRMNDLRAERIGTELDLEYLARVAQLPVHRHLTGPRASSARLGLGADVRGCVFDLDGVLTPSAELHVEAWQRTFDELLARHHAAGRMRFGAVRPFSPHDDYRRTVLSDVTVDAFVRDVEARAVAIEQLPELVGRKMRLRIRVAREVRQPRHAGHHGECRAIVQ